MFRRRQRERKLDVFFPAEKAQDVRRPGDGVPYCTHPCSLEAIKSQLSLKFVPDTHATFIPGEISHLTVYGW